MGAFRISERGLQEAFPPRRDVRTGSKVLVEGVSEYGGEAAHTQ